MLKLFRLIFIRNFRSILTLFSVLFLSSTGFLVMRELTENIEIAVSRETQPLFGADIRISPRSYIAEPLIDIVSPYLSGTSYSWWERTEFSTTLFDREGKTWLINVIAYTGEYPQKWILETSPIIRSNSWYIAATDGLLSRFGSWQSIKIDGRKVIVDHTIIKSSDLGFSFGSDNHLLILPKSALSGSMLISSGSRLDQDLFLSFSAWVDIKQLSDTLKALSALSEYRIQNYTDRSERTFETTEKLTEYILLILVIVAIFAGIILRSSHDALFVDLSRTLRIVETLWFSRRRQIQLFILLYSIIIPLSFLLSLGVSYAILAFIVRFPEASEFEFFVSPIVFTIQVLVILIFIGFAPPWIEKFPLKYHGIPLWIKKYLPKSLEKTASENRSMMKDSLQDYLIIPILRMSQRLSLAESVPLILGIWAIIWLIFGDFLWSILITFVSVWIFFLLAFILFLLYDFLFARVRDLREKHFVIFDAIRTLVRPLTPTISITLSLLGITSFFVVFLLFSLSFREKLVADTALTANIYAINILESDREKVEKILTGAEMYSILRARISKINDQSLAEHLNQKNPTGEFTREFNITTDTLAAPIVRGNPTLQAEEVSLDEDFSLRLGIDIGDRIEFLLSWKQVVLTVANIRKSVREWFRPFFYFSFEKEAFKNAPKTYFISTYTADTESWKQMILKASGPHVTFIDIENILTIVRQIATKILAVISLFFGAVSIFGVLAILTLFGRLWSLESMKSRLYSLFGAVRSDIESWFQFTRMILLGVSFIFSHAIGVSIFLFISRNNSFLAFSWWHICISLGVILSAYGALFFLIRGTQKSLK